MTALIVECVSHIVILNYAKRKTRMQASVRYTLAFKLIILPVDSKPNFLMSKFFFKETMVPLTIEA